MLTFCKGGRRYQLSCNGNIKRAPIKISPSTIPMTQILDLIFSFHICYSLFLLVLLLFLAALMRNQYASVFIIKE